MMRSGQLLSLGVLVLGGTTLFACASQAETGSGPVPAPASAEVSSAGASGLSAGDVPESGPPPAERSGWKMTVVASGIPKPWGMAWLPDGRILVTEKAGRLSVIERDGTYRPGAISGAPAVLDMGQGGFMDVALHPDFSTNRLVFFTFTTGSRDSNRTAVARGVLSGNQLTNLRTIWQVSQAKGGGQHFGARILFLPDKTMLVSIGDGGNPPARSGNRLTRDFVQDLGSHFGKVVRIDEEGRAPRDNPFISRQGALADIWSYGHRNIQGMARDPESGRIYANDHGARGGDELNLLEAGQNHGWPLATHSVEYSGQVISPNRSLPGMVDPLIAWTPSPAPSGLAFYTGDKFPGWRGDLFSGGLAGRDVRRVDLDAQGRVLGQTRLEIGRRVRDVRQGPDGFLYLLTDEGNGELIRIEPR